MSAIYDNWERLVAAVLRRQQLWELCHEQSISTVSSDSSFSFQLNSSFDDDMLLNFTSSNDSASNQIEDFRSDFDLDDFGETTDVDNLSRCLIKCQSPVVPANVSSCGNVSSLPRRKRNLSIQVPGFQVHNQGDFFPSPDSSEIYPNFSPRLQPRVGGRYSESHCDWPDYAKQQCHPLPLPPIKSSNSPPPFSQLNSVTASPSVPCGPGRMKILCPGSPWKKGKLLGKCKYGNVYAGFNSETGEMCFVKEVLLIDDSEESQKTSKKLGREIELLSSLKHPNIVRYYESEKVNDKFYIYVEYVSGGFIDQILKQYGNLGESALRSYTQQILAGLAYLHAKHTVHRNIKGAAILVDPNGCVKLTDFGMARHRDRIAELSCPLLCSYSPYWMAPEVIMNPNVCDQAIDIWSLGCTVLEMATSRPPWSQYEEVVAMFKIANCKELPIIPRYLSDDGKDFVKQCLQWNPLHRPTAAQLLEHPFVKSVGHLEKQAVGSMTNAVKSLVKSSHHLESERLAIHYSAEPRTLTNSRNISSPVSPGGTLIPTPIASTSPPTAVTGFIPYQYLNQSVLWHQSFCHPPKRPLSPSANSPPYWDSDVLQHLHSGQHSFREPSFNNCNAPGKQFGKSAAEGLYDRKLFSGGYLSQQLL